MELVRAEHAGACYGVDRALHMVNEALESPSGDSPVFTLGPLIHNPGVVHELEERGAHPVDSLDEAPEGFLVIRSHGVTAAILEEAMERGLNIVDATCPHVVRAQRSAARLSEEGYRVIIVGEEGHPEVEGIRSYAGDDCFIIHDPSELDAIPLDKALGVVVQTTQRKELLESIVEGLRARGVDPVVKDTICGATSLRQKEAHELASTVDVMIVIGGHNSGNTARLADICREQCPRTYHVENLEEIDPAWFEDVERVGVTAGASTPSYCIDEICAFIQDFQDKKHA